MQRRMVKIGVVACVLALAVGGLSFAQQQQQGGGAGRRQGGGPGGGPGGNFDPAQMRQMMMERMKEQLGVGDEEWKVMGPRVMKVVELNGQVSPGGRGGMGGMMGGMRGQRGGQGGPQGGANDGGPQPQADRRGPQRPQGQQSDLEKKIAELRTTLENSSASTEEIKNKLMAVRQAREKAIQELAGAQDDLKKVCTVRQEAQFVMMGLLK